MPTGKYPDKQRAKKWVNENPEVAPYKRSTAAGYREVILYALSDRDGWHCFYCGKELTESTATLEHVIPVALGGSQRLANLRLSCMNCNVRKGHEVRKARGWKWRKC